MLKYSLCAGQSLPSSTHQLTPQATIPLTATPTNIELIEEDILNFL